jgi:tetratricopeptide (TPR) repeat protein
METRYGLSEDLPREKIVKTWAMVQDFALEGELGFWIVFLAREYTWEISLGEGSQYLQNVLPRLRSQVAVGKEDPWVLGWALISLGRHAVKGLDADQRERYLSEALTIFRDCGVPYEQALTSLSLGDLTWRRKKSISESAPHYQAARDLFDQVGDPFGVATVWRKLAEIYLLSGDFNQAFDAFRQQGQVYERIGNRPPPKGSGTFYGNRDFQ